METVSQIIEDLKNSIFQWENISMREIQKITIFKIWSLRLYDELRIHRSKFRLVHRLVLGELVKRQSKIGNRQYDKWFDIPSNIRRIAAGAPHPPSCTGEKVLAWIDKHPARYDQKNPLAKLPAELYSNWQDFSSTWARSRVVLNQRLAT